MLQLVLAVTFAAGGASTAPAQEVVAAIQIHGNTVTSDEEITRIAGVAVGAPVGADTVATIEGRLRDVKRFDRVQVLKRFASIADPSQIVLVIIVDEGAVRIERTGDPDQPARAVRSRRTNLLFLPILNAEDGYGLTYGARFTWPDPAGSHSRISVPASWGGDKRAAVELDKTFARGPIDRISAGGALSRRTNPHFERDDDRMGAWVRAEHGLSRWLRAGGAVGAQRISFLGASDTFGSVGGDLVFDTRVDPVLPRNAVYARAAVERIAGAGQAELDVRGYLGVYGQSILVARLVRADSSRSLPEALKPLLGGMTNLRGFAAGTAVGDTLLATSAELILPLTSPLHFGRAGISGFVDAGTVCDEGERLADQTWKEGLGGSVWFAAAFVRLSVAVAHGRGSSTRIHVGANVAF